jgi:5-methylcytosine-specific restriction endonuclease McrA
MPLTTTDEDQTVMAKEYTPYTGRVVTREQAKAESLPYFFSDEPCIRDHLSQRYVSTGACLACQVVYLKKSRTKERERKGIDQAYKKERLEAQRVRQQRYDALHEDQERERKKRQNATEHSKALRKAWADSHREVVNAYGKKRYETIKETNSDKLKAQWRRNYWRDPARALEFTKRWQAANAEHIAAYRKANKEKIKAKEAEWAEQNRDKLVARRQAWRAKNPEKVLKWRKQNPESAKAIKLRYRALLASAEGNHTGAELKALFKAQDGKCAYCREPLKKGYHADHIQPLSKGGSNWIANIQLCCGSCNVKKNSTDPIVYARRLGRLL